MLDDLYIRATHSDPGRATFHRSLDPGVPAFTLLELIVVLLVLGILAAIAVPTFNRVKENSVQRVAQTTLEAAARNGEAIARSDGDATDEQIAAAVEAEFSDENGHPDEGFDCRVRDSGVRLRDRRGH